MCLVAQRSSELLFEVTVGGLQVLECLFSETAGLSPKNERIPGSGKIEKDILERWLGDVWKEENEQEKRKGAQRIGEWTQIDLFLHLALAASNRGACGAHRAFHVYCRPY